MPRAVDASASRGPAMCERAPRIRCRDRNPRSRCPVRAGALSPKRLCTTSSAGSSRSSPAGATTPLLADAPRWELELAPGSSEADSPESPRRGRGGRRRERDPPRQHYAATLGSVTHTLWLGGGIVVRPPRLRPQTSVLDGLLAHTSIKRGMEALNLVERRETGELRRVRSPRSASSATFAFSSPENLRRLLLVCIPPSGGGIHLSDLSDFSGPPQMSGELLKYRHDQTLLPAPPVSILLQRRRRRERYRQVSSRGAGRRDARRRTNRRAR